MAPLSDDGNDNVDIVTGAKIRGNSKNKKGRVQITHPWRLLWPNEDHKDNGKITAIVVLMGWWGAQPRHLEKYAREIYHKVGCATLLGIANSSAIMLKNDVFFRQYARDGLESISAILLSHPVPIVFHMFSNGGGFIYQAMEDLLVEAAIAETHHPPIHQQLSSITDENDVDNDENNSGTDTKPLLQYEEKIIHPSASNLSMDTEVTPLHSNTNLSFVRKRLALAIFDSAPAYPDINTALAALNQGTKNTFFLLRWLFNLLLVMAYYFESLSNKLRGKRHRLFVYWDQMIFGKDWSSTHPATVGENGSIQHHDANNKSNHENDSAQATGTSPSPSPSAAAAATTTPTGKKTKRNVLIPTMAYIYSTEDAITNADHIKELIEMKRETFGTKQTVKVLEFHDSPHVLHFREHPKEYTQFVHTILQEEKILPSSSETEN